MADLITRDEMALVLDEPLSDERFAALYALGMRVVRSGFRGDVDALDPTDADIVAGVLFGVMARILSNPKGARQLVGGPASVTFGGSDAEVAAIFTLTDSERVDLATVASGGLTGRRAFTIRPGA